jgi:DNA-binding transcriptional LysR family regulator
MDKAGIHALTVFLSVAQARSFTAAAHASGISVSAASYVVRQLETSLGARLFNRTTRSVSLTEAGQTLLLRATPLIEALQLALGDVANTSRQSMGTLKLNIPSSACDLVIKPLLKGFLDTYPEVNLHVAVDNNLVDIVGKGFDAGIRYDNVLADDMVVVPLLTAIPFCVVASPGYIAARGKPRHPRDLLERDCINYRSPDSGALYRWEFAKGAQALRVAVKGRLASNDQDLLMRAALDGFGYAYLQERSAQAHIDAGRLVRVLRGWVPSAGLYLYYYHRQGMPKKLRVLIDYLRAALRP